MSNTCIRHGYWLGKIIGLAQTYTKLPIAQDEQCNGLYGGLLCGSCREDAVFSFEAVNCTPSPNCKLWQPYVTLVLIVVFQFLLGLGL